MTGNRLGKALRLLQLHDPFDEVPEVTVACTDALEMEGLAVSLISGGVDIELLWCTDETTRQFEDLQFTLGQGPGPDTVRTGRMESVPDWAQVHPGRWPGLTTEVMGLKARAVFCFPLAIGAVHLGVLTAVRRTPGPLTGRQVYNASILAAALTAQYLNSGEAQLTYLALGRVLLRRRLIHQASGVVSAQLDIPAPQALLRLRTFAYSSGRSVTDVCQDVVDHRLSLDGA
ncbi:ANTAR domain-containing protein [Streptomyces sp. NBC_00986]|uniref:ANTAR domain-containing protein n=1 Tax=Streptomyces sp. NBC_00986 TaxID=2903702 RepID=UPI00386F1ABC|nr:ANTAR domain-containing protein [Streptomyces sp. NBC_00986]